MDLDRPRLIRGALALVPLAFLAVFYVLPVGTVLGEGLSAGAIGDVLGDARLRGIAWFTLWQAVASTALTIAVALPVAVVLSRYRFRGRSLVWAVVTVPFVLPTVVVAAAFVAILDRGGPLAGLGLVPGVAAILLAHVYFNVAVIARSVAAALATVDPALEDAARMLGASKLQALRRVTLPLVRPALVSASSIVFLFSFTSFGAVLLLGDQRRVTIDVEIWRQTEYLLDLRTAAGLSVLQLVAVVAAVVVSGRLQSRATGGRRQRDAARPVNVPVAVAVLVPVVVFLVAPLVVTAYRSVDGLGLDGYRALWESRRGSTLFVDPGDAVRNSVTFAAVATVLALVVGGCTAVLRGRVVDGLLLLPLGTSAVTIGLGFLLALDEPPLDLREWRWLVPVAHALVAAPFVARIVGPALRAVDPRLREAAAVLGCSPLQVRWRVDVPLVSRAVLVAAGFAFAVSLGEFGATVFLARPDAPTMPVAIFRFLGQPGALNLGAAMAMSTILIGVTVVVIAGIERFRVGNVGEL